jgi:hypothetical protein
MIIGVVSANQPAALMEELKLARRHVLEARRIVAEQRQRVDEVSEQGGDTIEAEQSLALFEQSLANLRSIYATLRAKRPGNELQAPTRPADDARQHARAGRARARRKLP